MLKVTLQWCKCRNVWRPPHSFARSRAWSFNMKNMYWIGTSQVPSSTAQQEQLECERNQKQQRRLTDGRLVGRTFETKQTNVQKKMCISKQRRKTQSECCDNHRPVWWGEPKARFNISNSGSNGSGHILKTHNSFNNNININARNKNEIATTTTTINNE